VRFDDEWLMVYAAIGVHWDALDASVSLNQVARAKGLTIRSESENKKGQSPMALR